MKIRPVGVELFHADGRTERHMAKLTVVLCSFPEAPKMFNAFLGKSHLLLGRNTRNTLKETLLVV